MGRTLASAIFAVALAAAAGEASAQGSLPPAGAGGPPVQLASVVSSLPSDRRSRINEVVAEAAAAYVLPSSLINAIIAVESDFNPWAVSRKGARGLMQLMPETAAMLGLRNVHDTRENVLGGARYLRWLLDRFGDLSLALAAYNAGDRAVIASGGIPPYAETQQYVKKVLALFGRAPAQAPRQRVYKWIAADGALVYSNLPPGPDSYHGVGVSDDGESREVIRR